MGALLTCTSDESTCNTPVGNFAVKHCSCFGSSKKNNSPEHERIQAELSIVEQLLLTRLRAGDLNIFIESQRDQIILHLQTQSSSNVV